MTPEQVQTKLVELINRRDTLEFEAKQHEAAAREKRSERDSVKADIEELRKLGESVTSLSQLQQAQQAADQAKRHAETHAASLQKMLADVEKLKSELDARLASIPKTTE